MFYKRLVIIISCILLCLFGTFSTVGCSDGTFTVRFESGADDASLYYGKQVQKVLSSEEIVEPIYIRPGYNFVGWNKSILILDSDTTVIAQWKAYDFEVTFYANGGADKNGKKTVIVEADSAYNLVQNQPVFTKTGYNLSWDIDLNTITSSCSVKAVWIPKKYDLLFKDKNGNDIAGRKMEVQYNDKVADITITPPNIQNQKFAYWKGKENGLPLDNGAIWKYDNNETFEPVYVSDSEFLIKYDLNGGKRGQKVYSYNEQDKGAKILENPVRDGYEFKGWLINGSTTPKLSQDITIEDFKVNGSYKDVKLTAVWENNLYTITFDADGGNIVGDKQKQILFDTKVGELPTAEKNGHTFVGWEYDGDIISQEQIFDVPSNVTIKAVYKTKYYVRFSLTTIIGKDNLELKCRFNKWADVPKEYKDEFEDNVLEVVEGQSLYSSYKIMEMPIVEPIERKGEDNYVFANCWQIIDQNGNAHKIDQRTLFNADNLGGIKGGETVVLVPVCEFTWSPNY